MSDQHDHTEPLKPEHRSETDSIGTIDLFLDGDKGDTTIRPSRFPHLRVPRPDQPPEGPTPSETSSPEIIDLFLDGDKGDTTIRPSRFPHLRVPRPDQPPEGPKPEEPKPENG